MATEERGSGGESRESENRSLEREVRSCPSDPFGELGGSGRAESERYGWGYLYALRKVAEMFSPTR